MIRRTVSMFVVCLSSFVFPTDAAAQAPYVTAAVSVDIVRGSGVRGLEPTGGEALGGTLRIGSPIGSVWGVELEVGRSGDIRRGAPVQLARWVVDSMQPPINRVTAIFPPPAIKADSQLTSFTTALWWRQRVNDRFDLRYLGGATFARTRVRMEVDFPWQPFPLFDRGLESVSRAVEQDAVDYSVGVTVGIETGITMTDHLRFVPGVRLFSVSSSWIVRSGVGLEWTF
jgi:hypothetical protein